MRTKLFLVLSLIGALFAASRWVYTTGYDKCACEQLQAELNANKELSKVRDEQNRINNSIGDVFERLHNGTF